MRSAIKLLCILLSAVLLLQPALLNAGGYGTRPAMDVEKRRAAALNAIQFLLLSEHRFLDFELIPGPTTSMPIFSFYRMDGYSALMTIDQSSKWRSLYLDSLGNAIISQFGCLYKDTVPGLFMPTTININGKGFLKVVGMGWNPAVQVFPKGQPYMSLRFEQPDGSLIASIDLRGEVGQLVMESVDAQGEHRIDSVKEDPIILKNILDLCESFYHYGCGPYHLIEILSPWPALVQWLSELTRYSGYLSGICTIIGAIAAASNPVGWLATFCVAFGTFNTFFSLSGALILWIGFSDFFDSDSFGRVTSADIVFGMSFDEAFAKAYSEMLEMLDSGEGLGPESEVMQFLRNLAGGPGAGEHFTWVKDVQCTDCLEVVWSVADQLFDAYAVPQVTERGVP